MTAANAPATDPVAVARWAGHQGAGRYVADPYLTFSTWHGAAAAVRAIEMLWNAEHKETWKLPLVEPRYPLTKERVKAFGAALFAWKDVAQVLDATPNGVANGKSIEERLEAWRSLSHSVIAELWLKGDPLNQAVAECILSWLAASSGTTWEDVATSVFLHGTPALKEAVMLCGLPRVEQPAEAV